MRLVARCLAPPPPSPLVVPRELCMGLLLGKRWIPGFAVETLFRLNPIVTWSCDCGNSVRSRTGVGLGWVVSSNTDRKVLGSSNVDHNRSSSGMSASTEATLTGRVEG